MNRVGDDAAALPLDGREMAAGGMDVPAGYDVVVLANGDFPVHAIPLAVLHRARHVVACDGAAASLLQSGAWRDGDMVVIGDGDSIPEGYRMRLIQVDEQDDNDLTKATRFCMERQSAPGPLRIAYLGCTGRREDHTLGNISLLMRYYRDFRIEPIMLTDYGAFVPAHGDRTFSSFAGQQVSIFNFGCTRIGGEGLKWAPYGYGELWQGTLNEALGNHFTLSADGYYMVYQTYGAKGGHPAAI